MMGKRFTDSEKYRDKWYRRLPLALKVGWDYLYHNCDCAGVIDLDEDRAEFEIGEAIPWDEVVAAAGDRVERLDCGKLWLTGFIEFQYGKLSDKCKPHVPVLARLTKHGIHIDDVRQNEQFKGGNVSKATRRRVYERDGNICCYCGEEFSQNDLTPDHVVPRSRGGTDDEHNLVAACWPCNHAKGDRDVVLFISKLPNSIEAEQRLAERLPQRLYESLKEKEKDKDKDKDKEKDRGSAEGEELSRIESSEVREAAEMWVSYKSEKRQRYKPQGLKALVTTIVSKAAEQGEKATVADIVGSMGDNYQGIVWGKYAARGSPAAIASTRQKFDLEAWAKQGE